MCYLKYWLLFLFALGLFETEVYGQVFELGFCQKPKVVANFNLDRYVGKWYNNRNYFAIFQAKLKCITAVYATLGSGITVTNEGVNIFTNKRSTAIGTGTIIEPGKIGVSFSGTPATNANYWVLGTDYDRYAVVWSCKQLGLVRISLAWILTRDAEPPNDVITDGLSVFGINGINTAPLMVTDHMNCPTR